MMASMGSRGRTLVRGVVRENESMSRHTSWRVGGAARRFFQPADIDDLAVFLSQLPADEPLYWIGLGSNLLVRDGGLPGTVICTSGVLGEIRREGSAQVYAEAGVPCAKVAKFCAREALVGAEFLVGIPGTMGGALAMNAGAFGGETWPLVVEVETIDRAGRRHRRHPSEYRVAYRSVIGVPNEWFVSAHLGLAPGDGTATQLSIKKLLARRNETQPMGQASCGSVFRNPEGDYAGRLIESCGLKGFRIGGACISTKHANFIINDDTASAADIEALIFHAMQTVELKCGVRLVPEVHIVGINPTRDREDSSHG
jgi:UDP-N-acetylmuramate dehydrogenase